MEKNKIPVSKALIENKEGEFLVVKKSQDYGFTAGKWEPPGGKIEEDEDRFEALKREVKEETGLVIEDLEDVVRIEVECENCINCYILHTESFSGDVVLSGEHSDFDWVSASEFRDFDWHRDSGYILTVMEYLGEYLEKENSY